MASKHRDLLEVLKLELEFLKSGGYGKPLSWRPQFIFEDFPHACTLAIPSRTSRVLSFHLPYQYCTKAEMESAVGEWLMNMIEKLERERASNGDGLTKKMSV